MAFKCQQCGNCCREFAGTLKYAPGDLQRWGIKERGLKMGFNYIGGELVMSNFGVQAIADFLEPYPLIEGYGDLWFHPLTGEELGCCPFLRKIPKEENKYKCLIYDIRPEICRYFPYLPEGTLHKKAKEICPVIKVMEKKDGEQRVDSQSG